MTPPVLVAPADPRARLEALRFLERNGDGTVAVLDDAIAKTSYFSRIGDLVLGARVQTISESEVTLADEKIGIVKLPYRGRAASAIEVRVPMEARIGHVPVHMAPSVTPAQVAADQAVVDEYTKSLPPQGQGRGGGGGGGGRGRNRDTTPGVANGEQGGRGRQRHLAERAAQEAAAAKARGSAGSAAGN